MKNKFCISKSFLFILGLIVVSFGIFKLVNFNQLNRFIFQNQAATRKQQSISPTPFPYPIVFASLAGGSQSILNRDLPRIILQEIPTDLRGSIYQNPGLVSMEPKLMVNIDLPSITGQFSSQQVKALWIKHATYIGDLTFNEAFDVYKVINPVNGSNIYIKVTQNNASEQLLIKGTESLNAYLNTFTSGDLPSGLLKIKPQLVNFYDKNTGMSTLARITPDFGIGTVEEYAISGGQELARQAWVDAYNRSLQLMIERGVIFPDIHSGQVIVVRNGSRTFGIVADWESSPVWSQPTREAIEKLQERFIYYAKALGIDRPNDYLIPRALEAKIPSFGFSRRVFTNTSFIDIIVSQSDASSLEAIEQKIINLRALGQLADNSIPQNGMSLYITLENETTPRLVTLYRGKLTVNSVLDDEIKSILMQDARLINQNAKWTSVVPSVINVVLLLSTITISDQTGIYSISLQSNQTVDNVISTHKFQINNTLSNIFNQISTQKYMVLVQNRSTFNMNSVGLGKVSALFNTPVSDYYFKSTFGMSANDYAALVEKYKIDYNTAINTITKGISDSSVPLPVKVNMQTSPVDFPVLFSMFNNLKNQRNVILWTAKKVNNNVTYVPSYLFTEETYNSKTGYSMKFLSTNFNTQLPVTLSNVNFFCKTSTTPSTFRGNSGNGNSYVDNLIFDCNY